MDVPREKTTNQVHLLDRAVALVLREGELVAEARVSEDRVSVDHER